MRKLIIALAVMLPAALLAQSTASAVRPLFDKKSIGEIRISLPVKNWTDALDSMRIYGDGMLSGSISVDGEKYESVGVRYRGDKSYQQGLKRNPFSIKLNYSKDQQHQGYTSLKISSALRDPSMVREILFYEIASKYMPAPQTSYIKLYVNDEYIGLFILIESIDGKFLRDHYNSDDNAFFKAGVDYKPAVPATCKQNINGSLEFEDEISCYRGNYEMNSSSGWIDLQDLTRALANDDDAIGKHIDIDRTLWMLALNNVMVNLNSYTGSATNYYLYEDDHGRFQPVHWDLNLAFGGYKNTGSGSDLEIKELIRLDPMLHANNPYRPLIQKLLKNDLYRKMYLAHIRQILVENFKNGSYEARAKELQAMIVIPFSEDKYKTYSIDDFQRSLKETVGKKSKIPGIVELMNARAKFLSDNPELTTLASSVSDINNQSRGKFENTRINGFRITAKADKYPKRMYLYYRYDATQPYTMMLMDEDASSTPSGTKKYVANVEAKSEDATIEYYIMAENAGTVSYSPSAYTSKPYKVKLSDLNK